MGRRGIALALLLIALGGAPVRAADLTPFAATDRLLVLAPHPDDEVLGCAGLVQRARDAGARVHVGFLTYGDANERAFLLWRRHPVVLPSAARAMGEVRHGEAITAAARLGLAPGDLTFLGYPDYGTMVMLVDHWGSRPPYRSLLTRATAVPYASAARPGAPYTGASVLADVTALLRDVAPTHVCVSHPADAHPDHRALYLYTRLALWDLAGAVRPVLLPYLVHHPHWPEPAGLHADLALAPPARLATAATWRAAPLTPAQRQAKEAALRAHATQMRAGADALLAFVRENELFGDLPAVRLGDATLDDAELPPPEGLTDAEHAALVGLTTRRIARDGDALIVDLRFARRLGDAAAVRLHLLGWRADRAFATMPKLRVEVGPLQHAAFDQETPLPGDRVTVDRRGRGIVVRVPLAGLGDPERVLVGARTTLADVPLAGLPWRIVELADPG